MNAIFVDTSGWLALVVKSDFLHERAVEIYDELLKKGCDFITHEGILLEVANSLSSAKARGTVLKLKESIETSNRIEMFSLSPDLIEAGWELYAERPDDEWSVIDCISFVVMRSEEMTEALTADKHFEQAGFVKLL